MKIKKDTWRDCQNATLLILTACSLELLATDAADHLTASITKMETREGG